MFDKMRWKWYTDDNIARSDILISDREIG